MEAPDVGRVFFYMFGRIKRKLGGKAVNMGEERAHLGVTSGTLGGARVPLGDKRMKLGERCTNMGVSR